MASAFNVPGRRTVGVRDVPLVLLAPRRLFRRVEDVTAYGWPFVVLLVAVTLAGYATVETGLIDRQIDREVDQNIAGIESMQRDVVQRSALTELYAQERKMGEFKKLLTRIQVIVAQPLSALGSVLLIAAVLYGTVALTGRKPEWHTLMTIGVYAGFIDLLRLLTVLGLMLHYRTLDVDTSLALLPGIVPQAVPTDPTARAAITGLLTAADPFRVWFWWVVLVGLSATAQLRGWRAWLACVLCWLVGAGVRCGLQVAAVASMASAGGMSS